MKHDLPRPTTPAGDIKSAKKRKPQHQIAVKTVGSDDSKISLCSESRLPENTPLKKTKNGDNNYRVPGAARGGRKRAIPANTVDTLRGGRKGDPQRKVVGKAVGSEDSKYRCVAKDGFQKTRLY